MKATISLELGGEIGKNTTNHVNSRGRRGWNKHATINLLNTSTRKRTDAAGGGEKGNNNTNNTINGEDDDVVLICVINNFTCNA